MSNQIQKYTFNKISQIVKTYFIKIYLSFISNEEKKFTMIYKTNLWVSSGQNSKSGPGSSLQATENIRVDLAKFMETEHIKSIFDIPCGDFNWMKQIELQNIQYLGGDIVHDLVEENQKLYENDNIKFLKFNLMDDPLPSRDIIFIRDLFIHLKDDQVKNILKKIISSDIKFLITTTYPETVVNQSKDLGDRWRPINLEIAPFNLPNPYCYLNDSWNRNSTDSNKKMGVWKVKDLKPLSNL